MMGTTNNIKRAILSIIKPIMSSTFIGFSAIKYPKVDVLITQIATDSLKTSYILTLDYWNNNGDFDSLDDIADNIGNSLNFINVKIDGVITIYKNGSRVYVPEKDNDKIVHITEKFELYHYSNKD